MEIGDIWTVEIGTPVKLLNGRFSKITDVNLDNELLPFEVEVFFLDTSLGKLRYSHEMIDFCGKALIERYINRAALAGIKLNGEY